MNKPTIISWCTDDYLHLSKGLITDCETFGYNHHIYIEHKSYGTLIEAWCNHPKYMLQGIKDFNNILFLDIECRIVQPLPKWEYPSISFRNPKQPFWLKYNTGTVLLDNSCSEWVEKWFNLTVNWDMGNLKDDDYIRYKNDICDEMTFAAVVDSHDIKINKLALEYQDRNTTAPIVRGLWKNIHTIIQHPTIHHWDKCDSSFEAAKLYLRNFPMDPIETIKDMLNNNGLITYHGWIFDCNNREYKPEQYNKFFQFGDFVLTTKVW